MSQLMCDPKSRSEKGVVAVRKCICVSLVSVRAIFLYQYVDILFLYP